MKPLRSLVWLLLIYYCVNWLLNYALMFLTMFSKRNLDCIFLSSFKIEPPDDDIVNFHSRMEVIEHNGDDQVTLWNLTLMLVGLFRRLARFAYIVFGIASRG